MSFYGDDSRHSLCQFRSRMRARMQQRQGHHQIIFAVDGIPYTLAKRLWHHAHMECWRSVFPSTSSTCWLSSLTGMRVEEHGVPGVVFRPDPAQPVVINVCDYQGEAITIPTENLFSDAIQCGYFPQAVAGDLLPIRGAWTRALLAGAAYIDNSRFYTQHFSVPPAQRLIQLEDAIAQAQTRADNLSLVWCFIDIDHYIHQHGYDSQVEQFLSGLESLAQRLCQQGCDVIAYADHGLVPTRHDEGIAKTVREIGQAYGAQMGGAGRTRWFYVADDKQMSLCQRLTAALGAGVDVLPRQALFPQGGMERMGNVLLIAREERFIAPESYCYEHGSLLPQEMTVPYAVWEARC
ncbi:alkaline phosphatase family protein [Serratia sp. NPDC078593]|uniref:alkaline phosphatase family protein n=1 Tax=unclassified Serratia (in: enterobacteria) TaxID=2647522 RepID=UPI0037D6DD61